MPPDTKKGIGKIADAINLILYGPPGTGKTYQLNRLVDKYSSRKQTLSREAWLIQELLDATMVRRNIRGIVRPG